MKTIAPNYYKQFHCIADRCRHSCCIGWEIDIDEASLTYYDSIDGEFGKLLAKRIQRDQDGAHFLLSGEDERCPFLKKNGLCEMILTLGEDSLCDICREHPRFYHFFSDRDEVGLGLCCEEAARLILSQKEHTVLEILDDDGEEGELSAWENTLLSSRQALFSILQNEEKPLIERIREALKHTQTVFPEKSISEWHQIFRSLERLDPEWHQILDTLLEANEEALAELEKPFEKLLLYFIYRHTAEAQDEKDLASRIAFAYLGYDIIRLLCAAKKARDGSCDFHDLAEFARRYCSEIEYSEENTSILLDLLYDCQ